MVKPIRTSADLAQTKKRLAELLGANGDGAHDDEIEVLSLLVERFERDNVRMEAPSPIAALKFRMNQAGLTPRQLEPFIGSRARVSEVLSGKRQLSLDMIRSLHEGLGIPYESLISRRSATVNVENVSAPAIDRLRRLGFDINRRKVPLFISSIASASSAPTLHRRTRTQRAVSKTDQTALLLWQAAVLKRSELHPPIATFDRSTFGAELLRKIARLSVWFDGPVRALRALRDRGVCVVILPALPGTFLDGAVMVGARGNPVIGLTLRHDRIDSFWFTLLHETAHVALHHDLLLNRGAVFVDDMEIGSEDANEREADELARESLIPSGILSQVRWEEDTTQSELVNLAIRARVHVAIAAGRWQRDHQNYKRFARMIDRGNIRDQIASDVPY